MQHTHRFRFAEFELDAELGVLTKSGEVVPIGPKPFCALALLVARAGALVSREELRREIWRDGVHVDFEHGLNECMRHVRAALGDQDQARRLVLTYPKRGYRLNVPVERLGEAVEHDASALHEGSESDRPVESSVPNLPGAFPTVTHRPPVTRRWTIAAALTAAVTGTFALTWPAGPILTSAEGDSSVTATAPAYPSDTTIGFGSLALPLRQPSAAQSSEARVWYGEAVASADQAWYPESHQAVHHLERAVALDPKFGLAHARLAIAYVEQVAAGVDIDRSRANARRAVEWATKVAPSLAETKVAAAELKYRMEDDYAGAEQAFAQAIALAPGNALPHLRYAMFLQKQLRFDEAIEQSRVAERLEPASLRARWELAYMLFLAGRCEESLPQVRRALELDANHSKSYRTLGQCLETLGRDEEAMEAYHAAGKIGLSHLGGLYARTGRTVAALRILEALRHPTATPQSGYAPLGIAYVYSGLGEHARAIEHVKEAQARGVQLPIAMRVAPGWAPLRAVVAFRQIEGSIEGAKAAVRSRRAATNERS